MCIRDRIKYRNTSDIQSFGYEANPSFYNIARVKLEKLNPIRPKENIGYELTNGVFKRVRTIVSKSYDFITGFMDDDGHDAFDIATIHSDFQVDEGDGYATWERPEDSDYEAETVQDFPLTQGSIRLKQRSYNSSNKGT
jgi:hypothetical protein